MIGFPGLGIEKFQLNKNVFTIGNFGLAWYGLIIAAGFFVAVLYCLKRSKDFHLTQDEIADMLLFAVASAVIGARLMYCFSEWDSFKNDLMGIIRIRDGGLSIYGGLIGALTAAALFCWVRHIHVGAMFDIGALGLLLGQTIGRWANFPNVELYGQETTLPWRMRVYHSASSFTEVHPLFLYESLWNLLGFLLLARFASKRRFNGQIFLCYLAWYGIGRGVLEGMRDPHFVMYIGDNIAISQVLALVSAVMALLLLGFMLIFKSPDPEKLTVWLDKRQAWIDSVSSGGNAPAASGAEDLGDSDDGDIADASGEKADSERSDGDPPSDKTSSLENTDEHKKEDNSNGDSA